MKNYFVFITDNFRLEELSENEKLQNLFLKDTSLFNKYDNTAFSLKNSNFAQNFLKKLESNGTTIAKMPEYYVSIMNCDDKSNENYKKALELVKMIKSEG